MLGLSTSKKREEEEKLILFLVSFLFNDCFFWFFVGIPTPDFFPTWIPFFVFHLFTSFRVIKSLKKIVGD